MGFFSSSEEKSQRRQKKLQILERGQRLLLTTADLKRDYIIRGIIQAESLQLLKIKAAKKGADGIVGIGFFGYDTQCFGTAVSFVKKENKTEISEENRSIDDEKTSIDNEEASIDAKLEASEDINEPSSEEVQKDDLTMDDAK